METKLYFCEMASKYDGDIPGYFMIGPFQTESEANLAKEAINEFYEAGDDETIISIYNHFGGYGYYDSIDSPAVVKSIDIKELPSSLEETVDLFKSYREKDIEQEEQERLNKIHQFTNFVDNVKQRVEVDKQDLSNMTKNDFSVFVSYTQKIKDKIYHNKIYIRSDEDQVEYSSEYTLDNVEITDGPDLKRLDDASDLLIGWAKFHVKYIAMDKYWERGNLYDAIYDNANFAEKLLVFMEAEIERIKSLWHLNDYDFSD